MSEEQAEENNNVANKAEENDKEENNEANTREQLNDVIDEANKVSLEESSVECEESLCLESTGEGLTVRFHCNCGRGYEFLLNGGSCYYKLL